MNAPQTTRTNCIICGKMATIWAGHLHINTCSPEMCVLAGRCDSCNNLLKNCEKSCYTEIISTMRNGPVANCLHNGMGCYGYWMDSKDKIQPSDPPKLTIHFSQCTKFHASNLYNYFDLNSPVNQCIEEFSNFIERISQIGTPEQFSCKTYLEHHILMAQQMHRQEKLSCSFIYYCSCNGPLKQIPLEIDSNGDFVDDVPHGFFGQ